MVRSDGSECIYGTKTSASSRDMLYEQLRRQHMLRLAGNAHRSPVCCDKPSTVTVGEMGAKPVLIRDTDNEKPELQKCSVFSPTDVSC
jgi:hypothetical protein